MVNDEQNSSIVVRFLSVGFFLIFALAALVWFILSMNVLISDLLREQPVISFDKGSMYMLGAGIGGLLFVTGGVLQGLLRKNLTPKSESFFAKSIIFSLILMFGLPHVTHYAVARYTHQKNYSICSDATYRWLLYSKVYYTKDSMVCDELAEQKK